MQFTLIIADSEDGKHVSMEMKRTDSTEDADPTTSNAAALVQALLGFLEGIDGDAVEATQKIVVQ